MSHPNDERSVQLIGVDRGRQSERVQGDQPSVSLSLPTGDGLPTRRALSEKLRVRAVFTPLRCPLHPRLCPRPRRISGGDLNRQLAPTSAVSSRRLWARLFRRRHKTVLLNLIISLKGYQVADRWKETCRNRKSCRKLSHIDSR